MYLFTQPFFIKSQNLFPESAASAIGAAIGGVVGGVVVGVVVGVIGTIVYCRKKRQVQLFYSSFQFRSNIRV